MSCAPSTRSPTSATRASTGNSKSRTNFCARSRNWRNRMIRLRSDCLVFEMSNGEKIPCSASTVTVELMGSAVEALGSAVVETAAAAVLHYFHHDLQRTEVTLCEFTE